MEYPPLLGPVLLLILLAMFCLAVAKVVPCANLQRASTCKANKILKVLNLVNLAVKRARIVSPVSNSRNFLLLHKVVQVAVEPLKEKKGFMHEGYMDI